jgi:hypothetical protein
MNTALLHSPELKRETALPDSANWAFPYKCQLAAILGILKAHELMHPIR